MIAPPSATVTVGGVTGIRLLVRPTSGVTPSISGQTTAAGKLGPAPISETGDVNTSGVGNVGDLAPSLSVDAAIAPAVTSATVVSQTVASGEVTDPGLANIKEKTPMCLVNELARFNKISHQYKLVDETGPAHKKTFSVVLKLGEEEYAASGPSIKKAQHAAAESALRDTKYKHPISRNRGRAHLLANTPTPTVELNALAMKRGDVVVYTTLEHPVPPVMAFGGLHPPPPPPHHLQRPVLGPGLSSNPVATNHYLPSSHHPHHRHEFPHPRYPPPPLPPPPPPPPPPSNRNFGPSFHPRGANCNGPPFHPSSAFDYRGVYNQRFHPPPPHHFPPPRPTKLFCVSLKVGVQEFIGHGATRQLARHQAATKALAFLRHLGPADDDPCQTENLVFDPTPTCDENAVTKDHESMTDAVYAPSMGTSAVSVVPSGDSFIDPVLRSMQDLAVDDDDDDHGGGDLKQGAPDTCGNDLKSEISLVHEITLKRRLNVTFHVVDESGPPHMRVYVTQCVVSGSTIPQSWSTIHSFTTTITKETTGENQLLLKTEAEGNGKKVSKKKAAGAMLRLLRTLPPLHQDEMLEEPLSRKGKLAPKKKRQNLIKVQKGNTDYGQGINPISRLIQIQQAKREKEPTFALLTERGLPRRREFVMQVTVNDNQCTGTGPNKKLAKRAAAEVMLQMMGYSKPSPQPDKPAIRTPGTTPTAESANKKVTFTLSEAAAERGMIDGAGQLYRKSRRGGTATLQQLPGVIFMPEGTAGISSIFGTTTETDSDYNSTTETPAKAKADGRSKILRLQIPRREASPQMTLPSSQDGLPTVEGLGEKTDGKGHFGPLNSTSTLSKTSSSGSSVNSLPSTIINGQLILPQVANGKTSIGAEPHLNGNFQPLTAVSNTQPRPVSQVRPVSSISLLPTVNVQQQQHPSTQLLTTPVASISSCHASPGSITIMSRSSNSSGPPIPGTVRPKQQLIYLAEVLGFHVNFTDFPKKGHGQEYLSLVSLTTNPPQVSHGSGPTLEASQDAASLHALKSLAELGLESVPASGVRGFVPLPNTTTSNGSIPTVASSALVSGNLFPAANGIANSMQQQQQQHHQPLQNHQNTEIQVHHVQHSHPHVQDLTLSTQTSTQQRMQHHLHAS